MKMVIDIDEKNYADIKKGKVYSSYRDVPQESVLAIANGTPLPKGHGRLIDADALYAEYVKEPEEFNGGHSLMALFRVAPTIIEADGGGQDES